MAAEDDDARQLDTFRQMAALQARVCYMNVDRTLATWTRTAMALIVTGIGVDRYGLLLLHPHLPHAGTRLAPNPVSGAGGLFLIALGVFIATTAAIRHEAYIALWRREYGMDRTFGPWMALPYAIMAALLGTVMLVLLGWFGQ